MTDRYQYSHSFLVQILFENTIFHLNFYCHNYKKLRDNLTRKQGGQAKLLLSVYNNNNKSYNNK